MRKISDSRFFKRYSYFRNRFRIGVLAIVAVTSMLSSALGQFEEMPVANNGSTTAYQLPEIISPENVTARNYIAQTSGVLAQTPSEVIQTGGVHSNDDEIVLAQYADTTGTNDWERKRIVLPSVRLVQGLVPTKVASVGRSSVNASPYRGAGRILQNDVFTEANASTSAVQTPHHLSELPPKPPLIKQHLATDPNQSEIAWDETEQHTSPQENNGYEVSSEQLRNSDDEQQNLYNSDVYGQYIDPYGTIYGGENNYGYYDYNSLPGVYGNEMYSHSGACPPLFAPGAFSNMISHILYSNVWENLTIGVGGSGFKSPLDQINGGAFGFHETVNWTSPSHSIIPVNFQAGFRVVQAYPSGYRTETGTWNRDNREQYFGTLGVFRRNLFDRPIHLGVAYDIVKDKYHQNYQLEQLRSELAFGTMYGTEYGYRGAKQLRGDSVWRQPHARVDIQSASYHTLFIKKYFANGGEGVLAGGATESGDPMIRAEYNIPLSNEWELKNSLMYVIPKNGHSPVSPRKESWGVSLQLIYQPHGGVLAGFCNPFRSFFDVGDNSALLQQTR
ncbi:MAG: hypothetical protein LBJ67_12545 [Planctomycetaceae bacterium]|jgi:hypothetical protein|nr:hypothetical protein [Planctomycetaceae bacterium]